MGCAMSKPRQDQNMIELLRYAKARGNTITRSGYRLHVNPLQMKPLVVVRRNG